MAPSARTWASPRTARSRSWHSKTATGSHSFAAQAQGKELRCERAMVRAGKPLGFAAGPLPDWARFGRATLAFGLSGPGRVRNLDVVEHFLASVAVFCRAAPWRF